MKQRVTNIILIVLGTMRYSIDYLSMQSLEGRTNSSIQIAFLFITFLLILVAILLNKDRLQDLNIDKASFVILLGVCIVVAWSSLPFTLSILMFVAVGYLVVEYRKQKREFIFAGFPTKFLGVVLCVFLPLMIFLWISNAEVSIERALEALASASFLGVVFEEFLFRGLLWKYIRDRGAGEYSTVTVQAILFWLAHYQLFFDGRLSFWTTLPLVAVGLGALVLRSKSLTISIVAHFLYNVCVGLVIH